MNRLSTSLFLTSLLCLALSGKAQVLYQQDFESGSGLPAGWTQTTNASDGGWLIGTASALSSQYYVIPTHTKILATNDDGCDCDKSNDVLKTPAMDFSGTMHPYVSFDLFYREGYYADASGTYFESLLLKASTDGGANWTLVDTLHYTADAGGNNYQWNNINISLAAYGGQSNVMLSLVYNDGGSWLYGAAIDNFKVYTPPATDVVLTSINPVAGYPDAYAQVGSNINFSGTIYNQGYNNLTSATLNYTVNGGAPVSYNLTGIDVAPFTSYNFTIPTGYTVTSTAIEPVLIGLTVAGDASANNDTMSTAVAGYTAAPTHVLTVEEGTGTWCGWCPRGAVYMEQMNNTYSPSDVALIAVHNSSTDPMRLAAYDNGVSAMVGGYPSVLLDRRQVLDPSELPDSVPNHLNNFGFANLSATSTYNASTRSLGVTATADFKVELHGDYRLALVLTEDGVHGNVTGKTNGWAQHNYYSYQNQNIPLVGAGHDWQAEDDSVPAELMSYNFVARYISGGFNGVASSLPASIPVGSTQTYTFPNVTLNNAWYDWNMKATVLLIDATRGFILNAVNLPGMVNGVTDVASQIDRLSLYPNPTENTLNVVFSLKSQQNLNIELTDVLGKVVASYDYKNVATGVNQVALNTEGLANGIYFANIKTDSGVVSRKFVKQ